jgi:hypothetical protein
MLFHENDNVYNSHLFEKHLFIHYGYKILDMSIGLSSWANTLWYLVHIITLIINQYRVKAHYTITKLVVDNPFLKSNSSVFFQ